MSEIRTRPQGGTPFFPNMLNNGNVEVCLKEDVDKVIAELEERIADGDKDFEIANNQNERLLKIVRHHKYKRCLAMAKWCHSMWILLRDEHETKRSVFYWRWWNLWMEFAEKLKEAKHER